MIAEYLIKRDLEPSDKKRAITYIRTYKGVIKGNIPLSSLNEEKKIFIVNLERLIRDIEGYKIELTNKIGRAHV